MSSARIPVEIRFWSKVDKTPGLGPNGDCWEWIAGNHTYGYGQFKYNKKLILAHRMSWFLSHDETPELFVCHKCDNPSCVNPEHLFLGTPDDNMIDKVMKERQAKGEENGRAKLTEPEVLEIFKSRETLVVLAERYNVHHSTIFKIKKQKIWKYITNENIQSV